MAKKISKQDAARIQSTQAKKSGGQTKKSSFGSRTQKAADKNANS